MCGMRARELRELPDGAEDRSENWNQVKGRSSMRARNSAVTNQPVAVEDGGVDERVEENWRKRWSPHLRDDVITRSRSGWVLVLHVIL